MKSRETGESVRRVIPGRLGLSELLALSGKDPETARMAAFHCLSRDQQAAAILRLHQTGYSDTAIASATKLSREFVMRVIAEQLGEQRA